MGRDGTRSGWAILLVSVCSCACGNSTGTVPSPVSPSPHTFSLRGNVSSIGATPASVTGATLSIVDGPDAGKSTATDGAGTYSFSGLQPSGFTVTASAANYIAQSRGVTLLSDQTLNFLLRPQPAAIVLNGRVTDATTFEPITGAVVSINGRYRAITDSAGVYSLAGLLDAGSNTDTTRVFAENYVDDYRYIRGTIQNVRLYRIERIVAGKSTLVTIAPDDTLCVNNMQDSPGIGPDYVCRSAFIVAPSDGAVTVEAVSTHDGAHPPLEVETRGVSPCCSERIGNPTTIHATAGTTIVANVEMRAGSISAQSFAVHTALSQQEAIVTGLRRGE